MTKRKSEDEYEPTKKSSLHLSRWLLVDELLEQLVVGDMVEFQRTFCEDKKHKSYSHWGVYIGCEMVGHFAVSDHEDFITKSNAPHVVSSGIIESKCPATIRTDDIHRVAGHDLCRKNNSLDKKHDPLPGVIIKDRICANISKTGYNLFFNNCEHLAKWARYNYKESDQAAFGNSVICGVVGLALSANIISAVAVGGIGYSAIKSATYINRKFAVTSYLRNGLLNKFK
uniref:LRAT domain-containing protein n=1 Tax=Rhabditophanes sp. KR3021 TaxID=114890 RepID=A0AC35TRC5_9BILA